MSSLIDDARDTATETASQVKGTAQHKLWDIGAGVLKTINMLHDMEIRSTDKLLDRVGLQRRESMVRPAMLVAAGLIVGGGAALLFAPTSGKQLRRRMIRLFENDVVAPVEGLASDAMNAVSDARQAVGGAVAGATQTTDNSVSVQKINGKSHERR